MFLPSPLPDDPRKWDGWKGHDSPNAYERLCLSFDSHPDEELIEDHCRQLLVWWQKKLPLRHQPNNPLAQLLRGGLDVAPSHLAEARAALLDPAHRSAIDEALTEQRRQDALLEFQKFLDFALADKVLSKEAETNLLKLGRTLGLGIEDLAGCIALNLEQTGATREVDEPPPPSLPEAAAETEIQSGSSRIRQSSPQEAFRRMLQLSKLDAGSITLDHRDTFGDMAEKLGLDARGAEDLIEEYLGAMAHRPAVSTRPPLAAMSSPLTVPRISAFSAMSAARSTRLVTPREQLSPDEERRTFPSFHNSIGAEMLLITTGRFLMGSHSPEAPIDEQPSTRVTLRRFYLSRHPITVGQYGEFDPLLATRRNLARCPTHPVTFVSYFDANRFCDWLGERENKKYRLPTEAEWEYAARGTDGRIYPWAKSVKPSLLKGAAGWRPDAVLENAPANCCAGESILKSPDSRLEKSSGTHTTPVGDYPRGSSPFGIEDLSGNVWEWCQDFYAKYQGAERMNPVGPPHGTHRVCRGGSWKTRLLKAATRGYNLPTYTGNDVGLRIVCECQ